MTERDSPRSVFITGATGFIGKKLAGQYRQSGWKVSGVDLKPDLEAGVVGGDITQRGEWQEAMSGANLVIHTAAKVGLGNETEEYWRINCVGTKRVLEAASRGRVDRFVQISSIAAFGFDYPDGADESYALCPNGTPYVDTKIASEHAVLQAHAAGEVVCTIIRPGDVYGPDSVYWTMGPMREISAGKFLLPAHGRGIFTPVYIDDLIEGIILAAEHPAAAGEIFTMTGEEKLETYEFFQHYSRMLNAKKIRTLPTNLTLFLLATIGRLTANPEVTPHVIRFLSRRGGYSIEKAKQRLGYQPQVNVEEGMRRIEDWLQQTDPLKKK